MEGVSFANTSRQNPPNMESSYFVAAAGTVKVSYRHNGTVEQRHANQPVCLTVWMDKNTAARTR